MGLASEPQKYSVLVIGQLSPRASSDEGLLGLPQTWTTLDILGTWGHLRPGAPSALRLSQFWGPSDLGLSQFCGSLRSEAHSVLGLSQFWGYLSPR